MRTTHERRPSIIAVRLVRRPFVNGSPYALGPSSVIGLLRLHDTTGCQPVWQPVSQQVASCKRGFSLSVCLSCIVGVLWPKSWIDQDATWSGGRPRPRRHCYRWGPSFAQGKRHSSSPLFGPWSIVVKRSVYIHFGPETVRPMTLRHQCRTVRNKTYRNWCPVSRHFSIDGAEVSRVRIVCTPNGRPSQLLLSSC